MEHSDTGDVAFMGICAALVLFMTPGLAFYYGGLVQVSSILNTMMMCMICVGLVSFLWMTIGFSLAFNGNFDNAGLDGLSDSNWPGTKIPGLMFATFQMTFAVITTAIISGAVVERMRFGAFMVLICLWLLGVYVPLCNWVWGGGWIHKIGAKDFAGGTVVHISSGTAAHVLSYMLGKRSDADQNKPHNVPFVILGGSVMWFGWTGFNGGSALHAGSLATLAITNTLLAAAVGMVTWVAADTCTTGTPSAVGAMTGAVAGLVGITPIAGFVSPTGAIVAGVIAAICCLQAVKALSRLKLVDDALGCFGVHSVGGFVGACLGGLLDTEDGVLYGKGFRHLGIQALAASAGVLFSALATLVLFLAVRMCMRVRATVHEEQQGIDRHSHSENAYSYNYTMFQSDAEILATQREIVKDITSSTRGSTGASQADQSSTRKAIKHLGILGACLGVCASADDEADGTQAAVVESTPLTRARAVSSSTELAIQDPELRDAARLEEADEQKTCCCGWLCPPEEQAPKQELLSNFTATIDCRFRQHMGLLLDCFDEECCLVSGIKDDGLVALWNRTCPREQVIKQGDLLVGVNGCFGKSKELFEQMVNDRHKFQTMKLKLKRAKLVSIVKKTGSNLGIALNPDTFALGIKIESVDRTGAVPEYNVNAPHSAKIKPGDRVVKVNDILDNSRILEAVQDAQSPELRMEVLVLPLKSEASRFI